MTLDPEVKEQDLYSLLGVEFESDTGAIRRAYRKLSLKYHPDKNGTAEAADMFHKLSVALDVLSNEATRKEYDNGWRARRERAEKRKAMDGERRRQQEELEKKEKAAAESVEHEKVTKRKVEILQAEGSRKRQMFEEAQARKYKLETESEESNRTVKVRWKQGDASIDEADLKVDLAQFGEIELVAMVAKPKTKLASAVVVFKSIAGAREFVRGHSKSLVLRPVVHSISYQGSTTEPSPAPQTPPIQSAQPTELTQPTGDVRSKLAALKARIASKNANS